MRNLFKLFALVVLVAFATSVNAQVKFGVKAGLNASTFSGLGDGFDGDGLDTPYKLGFHVGVSAQYMLTEAAGIESGLYYSALGAKENFKEDKFESKTTYSPSYLQLPVAFIYKFNVGPGLSLYPSAGLYAGYGIGGKIKEKETGSDPESNNFFGKPKGATKEYTNRFDMGATIGLNLEFSQFTIGLGYDAGLLKINKEDFKDENGKKLSDLKNQNIKVSVGYYF